VAAAIDASGAAHLAYAYAAEYEDPRLKYATNASGEWVSEEIEPVTEWYNSALSMALDAGGNAHIVYVEPENYRLKYADNVAGDWNIDFLDSTAGVSSYPSIAVDQSGTNHVLYQEAGNYVIKYAAGGPGAWRFATLDQGSPTGGTGSMILDGNDTLHVVYLGCAANGAFPGLYYATFPIMTETGGIGR